MMGLFNRDQGQLFYEFRLDEVVLGNHLMRKYGAVLDLSWAHGDFALHYSPTGQPINLTQS